MSSDSVWTAAITGVAAAFVGFGTAAFGYWRTRRDERRDAAARARAARIGRVQSAVYGDLAHAMSWYWLPIGSGVLKVMKAVAEFSSAELADHPAVAMWSLERLKALGRLVRDAERWWLLPGDRQRRAALMEAGSELAAALAAWESGVVGDAWFADRLSPEGRQDVAPPASRRRPPHRARTEPPSPRPPARIAEVQEECCE